MGNLLMPESGSCQRTLGHQRYSFNQRLRAAQEYLVHEIQKVYESQGIPINDKHFEVIVRKMSDEVRIVTTGDTPFLPGELTSKASFEEENEKVLAAGGEPASAQQVFWESHDALFIPIAGFPQPHSSRQQTF